MPGNVDYCEGENRKICSEGQRGEEGIVLISEERSRLLKNNKMRNGIVVVGGQQRKGLLPVAKLGG